MNWIILCTHIQDGTELNTNRATAEQDEYKSQQVSVLDSKRHTCKKYFQSWIAKGNVLCRQQIAALSDHCAK